MVSINKPYLVINADDFGWFEQRDIGIIEGFETGSISSSTAIANGSQLESSLEKIKDSPYANRIGIGLHINLTDGPPIYTYQLSSNTLIGEYMWYPNETDDQTLINGFHGLFPLHSLIKKGKIKDEDIENEIRAQLTRFVVLRGKLPTHIDGHKHIQMIPQIAKILARVMTTEFGIYRIRLSRDESENLSLDMQQQYTESIKIYQSYGITSTDYFFGKFSNGGGFTKDNIIKSLNGYKDRAIKNKQFSVEMMCHVGYPCVRPAKTFSSSQQRVKELRVLQNEDLQKYIDTNFNLVPYDEVKAVSSSLRVIKSVKEQLLLPYRVIVSCCDMVEEEECIEALESICQVLKDNNDVCFVQIRRSSYSPVYLSRYMNRVNQLNIHIQHRIFYIHSIDSLSLIKNIQHAFIYFNYSYNYSENNDIILAMSHNVISIVRNTQQNLKIIQDQITAITFSHFHQVYDKFNSILQDKLNSNHIRTNAYNQSQLLLKEQEQEKEKEIRKQVYEEEFILEKQKQEQMVVEEKEQEEVDEEEQKIN